MKFRYFVVQHDFTTVELTNYGSAEAVVEVFE